MMTTDNIYKEPEAVAPPTEGVIEAMKRIRKRRTKAEMEADEAAGTLAAELAHDSSFVTPLDVAARPAADWLCNNLLPNTPGWIIGDNLKRALEGK